MIKRRRKTYTAILTTAALTLATVCVPMPQTVLAAGKAPSLSREGKTLKARQNFLLRVKQNKVKKIVKTVWSINDAGADYVVLSQKKKTSVRVLAMNDAGTAKVKAKVKYQIVSNGKTETRTKKLTCTVIVKADEATPVPATTQPFPTIAPTVAPTATATPSGTTTSQYGTMSYNATDSAFEITFTSAQQNANNPDSTEASGLRVWTTNVSKIARINWQGSSSYLLTLTRATLDPSGMRLTIYADPGSIRMGACFDAVLTGFYGNGEAANAAATKAITMSAPVSSLQAVVDTHLTQPVVGDNKTICLSVCFNQPMKSSYAYDRSPAQTGTLELGGWQASANQIAKVYEVTNGKVSTQAENISGATAYKPKDDDGIERVIVDLGKTVSSGTREYRVVLNGFSPNKSGGIAATELSTQIKFTPEALNITGGSYELLKATTSTNGESTDVIIRLNVANAKGSGVLMKKSDTREQGWPSDYVTVKDVDEKSLTVGYIKSTLNSNQIEIGVTGGRSSTKFHVLFSAGFPYAFLSLTSSQLVSVNNEVIVTANGASSGGSTATDTATYDASTSYFKIQFSTAYTHIYAPDEGQGAVERKWGASNAAHMFNFYKADSSGGYSESAPLTSTVADEVILSADGKTLRFHVDPAKLTVGTRYAIVPVGFVNATTMYPLTTVYYSTVRNGGSAAISISRITSARETGTSTPHTVFVAELSADFTVATAYDSTPSDNSFKGIWTTNARSVVTLNRIDNTVISSVAVSEVDVMTTGNMLRIVTTGEQAAGTYRITLMGIRPAGTTSDTTLTADYVIS